MIIALQDIIGPSSPSWDKNVISTCIQNVDQRKTELWKIKQKMIHDKIGALQ